MVNEIFTSRDGMQRLTEAMLLSVIEQYIPYIFGPNAKLMNSDIAVFSDLHADFIVSLPGDAYAIVEVRNQAPNTRRRMEAAATQLNAYATAFRQHYSTANVSRVLIINGTLSTTNRAYLASLGVDRILDTDDLLRIPSHINAPKIVAPVTRSAGESSVSTEESIDDEIPELSAEMLLKMLEDMPLGRSAWSQYQKLVGDILEFLFCPSLDRPIPELPNQARTNRRDFVFPNYAINGFWASLRLHYAAHFVVVDAKNLKGFVTKTEVLQIANYLSDHGAGLFGLIVSRNGGKYGAEVTQREQWAIYRKMIVILDDADLKQMLAINSSNGDPSDLIRQKIEDFRLGF